MRRHIERWRAPRVPLLAMRKADRFGGMALYLDDADSPFNVSLRFAA
jgi:hypothetical protein